MVRCHVCETEVGEDAVVCPEGHVLGSGSGGVVMPEGHDARAGSMSELPARGHGESAGGIRLVTMTPPPDGTMMREALGALAEDLYAEPLAAAAPPDIDGGVAAEAVVEPPVQPAMAAQDQGMTEEQMLVPPEATMPETVLDGPDTLPMAAVAPTGERSFAADVEIFGKPARAPRGSRRGLLVVPLVLALVAGAGGFVLLGGDSAEAATYRRLFTNDETHRYAFEMTMDGAVHAGPVEQPMDMSVRMTLTERTTAVEGGIATIRQTIDSLDMRLNGERAPIPDLSGIEITVRIAPDGKVVSVDGLGALGLGEAGPATDMLGPNSFGPLLPSHAVAPGDEWTVEDDMPTPFGGSLTLTARNRLVQRGSEGGIETALIRSELDMPMNMRVGLDELLAAAGDLRGLGDAAGMPKGAAFVYEGGMRMDLLQTVAVATGRPLNVSGSGSADIRMSIEGMRGAPAMRMVFSIKATMSEVRGTTAARALVDADAPLSA